MQTENDEKNVTENDAEKIKSLTEMQVSTKDFT